MNHPIIMIMGVAGSGKKAIGQVLAQSRDVQFLDGDDCHSKAHAAHLAAGRPLSDDMCWTWLDAVGHAVKTASHEGNLVFACSGLKRIYRDYLRAGLTYKLIYPEVSFPVAQKRFVSHGKRALRMKILRNQFDILEAPTKDEAPICVHAARPIEKIMADIKIGLA